MKCPACGHRNDTGATECHSCGVVFAHARKGRGDDTSDELRCSWVADGTRCQHRWVIRSGGRNLCRLHDIECTGTNPHQVRGNNLPQSLMESLYGHAKRSERKRWTQGHRVADDAPTASVTGKFGIASTYLGSPPARQREPGDDDEEI